MDADPEKETIGRILELARWAPSGDNTQPWRFEIRSDRHLVVHGSDTRHTVVYDREGFASQIAIGALLESIVIAASGYALKVQVDYRPSLTLTDESPRFDVRFDPDPEVAPDPLLPFLKIRSVNRRPMKKLPLSHDEKAALASEISSHELHFPPHRVSWLERGSDKRTMAWIAQSAGKLRLTIPEAYEVHRSVIEWNARYSLDRIPDQALGLSHPILPLMRWIMGSWSRIRFFNRFLGGTLIPRLELDLLPALACSAHFVILAKAPPKTLTDYVDAGRAICRFWLETTRLGLQLQPEMAPLVFRAYAARGVSFSNRPGSMDDARKIGLSLNCLIGQEMADRAVFLGRIGRGTPPQSRSLRRPLLSLIKHS